MCVCVCVCVCVHVCVCVCVAGRSVTTVLVQVSGGKRPGLDMVPDDKPHECDQMIDIMEQCWDQDLNKRPQFAGIPKALHLPRQHMPETMSEKVVCQKDWMAESIES